MLKRSNALRITRQNGAGDAGEPTQRRTGVSVQATAQRRQRAKSGGWRGWRVRRRHTVLTALYQALCVLQRRDINAF
jgi:hypothetical protein